MPIGMLIDTTRCILCRACQVECHKFYVADGRIKDQPAPGTSIDPDLDVNHFVVLKVKEVQTTDRTQIIGVSKRCMHCFNPACVSVCPVGALQKQADGAVTWDTNRCIGCRYCMNACPFGIPKFEWNASWPRISKCIFCEDKRLVNGQNPVCADACPTQAIRFGERADMIALAYQRIQATPEKYFNHVYGENEAGGTSVLYIGAVPPEQLGFSDVADEEYPPLTWEFLSRIPLEMAALALVLSGIYFWRSNRMAKLNKTTEELPPGEEKPH